MTCFHPITAFRSKQINENGKRPLVFNNRDGYNDLKVTIPCGQCIGCRIDKSKEWAIRCVHESKQHDENSYITLTYDDDNLELGESLNVVHFQKFMKRLRKYVFKTYKKKIRFFHCGEYGDKFARPHYHAIIFGFGFPDKEYFKKDNGNVLYISKLLSELWPYGLHTIGKVTYDSCAYVARYVTKKINGEKAEEHYQGRSKEYVTMSRRPGIGQGWFDENYSQLYPNDSILLLNGKSYKVPRFYKEKYIKKDLIFENEVSIIDTKKRLKLKNSPDNTFRRLRVRELVTKHNLENKKRGFENGSKCI